MPPKVRNYAKSTINIKDKEQLKTEEQQYNGGIFLTEDFLNQS